MRKAWLVLLPVAILALIALAVQSQESAAPKWIDPAACHFCQPLTQTEGLLDNLGWEHHKTKAGMVTVTTYTPEWKEKYKGAMTAMQARWTTFDPANPQPLCGMCAEWMKVPMDKVVWETVEFKGGEIGITTSADPAVVAQLHAITDKTCAAMDEMMKKEPPAEQ